MVEPDVLEEKIRNGIEGVTEVQIEDLTGTKDHYRAVIVASAFEGMSRVDRHRAVYGALGALMQGPVHALTIEATTPQAWAEKEEA